MQTVTEHRAVNENVVEKMHDFLRDVNWSLMTMNADETGHSFISTYGLNTLNLPDYILGFQVNEDARSRIQYIISRLNDYFHDMGEVITTGFDLNDFVLYVQQQYTDPEDVQFVEQAIRELPFTLVELDPVVWFNGHGMHHRMFYPVDVRMRARFVQILLVDSEGREPRAEGFNGHFQRDLVRLGEEKKVVKVNPNLTKYLH
jgi:hypothetical protein